MRSSDLYFYAASMLWIVWLLYISGFFKWAASLYFRLTYYFTLSPPKSTRPVDTEKLAELMEIWSPSSKMPGAWSGENTGAGEQVEQGEEKDVVVVVECGFVLVKNEVMNC
jgi:hypothetical protein